jgi:hypothetical protein
MIILLYKWHAALTTDHACAITIPNFRTKLSSTMPGGNRKEDGCGEGIVVNRAGVASPSPSWRSTEVDVDTTSSETAFDG